MDGALLINKHEGVSSFGVIELLQKQLMETSGLRKRDLPKLGHGGTLDPFATGLLSVCVGRAVKLARYFLGAGKTYEGTIRFGETTVPGDPTSPVTERSDVLPESIERIQAVATQLTLQPYLQVPPMHSAKKLDGKPLYELARQGLEVEREARVCHLYEFQILSYEKPRARIRVRCSSGTYVRTLAQDLGRMLGTVAMLESLHRTASGIFSVRDAWSVEQIRESGKRWDELPCWVPFDRLLEGYGRAEATIDEAASLLQGRQSVLFNILKRAEGIPDIGNQAEPFIAIYCKNALVAVARRDDQSGWGLERVFTRDELG